MADSNKNPLEMNLDELIAHINKQGKANAQETARFDLLLRQAGGSYAGDKKQLDKALGRLGVKSAEELHEMAVDKNGKSKLGVSIGRKGFADATTIKDPALRNLHNTLVATNGNLTEAAKKEAVATLTPYMGAEAAQKEVASYKNGYNGSLNDKGEYTTAIGKIGQGISRALNPSPYSRGDALSQNILSRHQYSTTDYRHLATIQRQMNTQGAQNIKMLLPNATDDEVERLQSVLTSTPVKSLLSMTESMALNTLTGGDPSKNAQAAMVLKKLKTEGESFIYGDKGNLSQVYYDMVDGRTSAREKDLAAAVVTSIGSTDLSAENGFMRAEDARAVIQNFKDTGRDLFAGIPGGYALTQQSVSAEEEIRKQTRARLLEQEMGPDSQSIKYTPEGVIDRAKTSADVLEKYDNFDKNFGKIYDDVQTAMYESKNDEEAQQRLAVVKDRYKDNKWAQGMVDRVAKEKKDQVAQSIVKTRLESEHMATQKLERSLGRVQGIEKVVGGPMNGKAAMQMMQTLGGYGTATKDIEVARSRTTAIAQAASVAGVDAERMGAMVSKANETLQEYDQDTKLTSTAAAIGMRAYQNAKNAAGQTGPFDAERMQAEAMDLGAMAVTDSSTRNLAWLLNAKAADPNSELGQMQQRFREGKQTAEDVKALRGNMEQFRNQVEGGPDRFDASRTQYSMDRTIREMKGANFNTFMNASAKMLQEEGAEYYTNEYATAEFMKHITNNEDMNNALGGRENIQQAYQSLVTAGGFKSNEMADIISGKRVLTDDELKRLKQVLPEDAYNQLVEENKNAAAMSSDLQDKLNDNFMEAMENAVGMNDEDMESFDARQASVAASEKTQKEIRDQELLDNAGIDQNKSIVQKIREEGLTGMAAVGALVAENISGSNGLSDDEIVNMSKNGTLAGVLLNNAGQAENVTDFMSEMGLKEEDVGEFLKGTGYEAKEGETNLEALERMRKDLSAVDEYGNAKMSGEDIKNLGAKIRTNKWGQRLEDAALSKTQYDYDTAMGRSLDEYEDEAREAREEYEKSAQTQAQTPSTPAETVKQTVQQAAPADTQAVAQSEGTGTSGGVGLGDILEEGAVPVVIKKGMDVAVGG